MTTIVLLSGSGNSMVRVMVTGGRKYRNFERVRQVFTRITNRFGKENLTLICGMAAGADSFAWHWANVFEWKEIEEFHAKWNQHGKRAGVLRNVQMVESKPDFCVAFPGGKGTAHAIEACKKAGIMVYKLE